MADARRAREAQALELRRAGVPIRKIMEQLGFRTREQCEKAIERALVDTGLISDPVKIRLAELDRLDRLHTAVWAKAVRGDVNAIDRVVKLTEMRMRLSGVLESGITPLTEAYERTIESLRLAGDMDAIAVASGRRICQQIDAASALGDPVAVTKAFYLMPHLMTILRELGATPAARGEVMQAQEQRAIAESENVTSIDQWKPETLDVNL